MAHFNQFLSIWYSIRYVFCHWHLPAVPWGRQTKEGSIRNIYEDPPPL